MSEQDNLRHNDLRHDLEHLVRDLRATLQEIGSDAVPQTQVVSDTRDRLRYIASLTEQAASQTLNFAEGIGDRLSRQQQLASLLEKRSRSPETRAFLQNLQLAHTQSRHELSEIIQAQAFQDLVGQVINKLMITVEKMETGLAHLLIEAEPDPGLLAGPQVKATERVSQDDIDSLFD
jgi:chemotaxis protein CheZ